MFNALFLPGQFDLLSHKEKVQALKSKAKAQLKDKANITGP